MRTVFMCGFFIFWGFFIASAQPNNDIYHWIEISLDSPMRTVFIVAAQPSNENGIYGCRTTQQRVSIKQTLKQRFPWPTRLVHSALR
jgi:hypothetical protein